MENENCKVFNEVEALKYWMDALILHIKQGQALKEFNGKIEAISPVDYIHIYSGIDIMADILGVELLEGKLHNGYEYYFLYNGVKFLKYSEERWQKYARAD